MRQTVTYQIGGVIIQPMFDGSHREILSQISTRDLEVIIQLGMAVGWKIKKPKKYLHIPQVKKAVEDGQKQLLLPFASSPGRPSSTPSS